MSTPMKKLHDHLMDRIEALAKPALKGNDLKEEISRSRAVTGLANSMIDGGRLALEAEKVRIGAGENPGSAAGLLADPDKEEIQRRAAENPNPRPPPPSVAERIDQQTRPRLS